MLSDPRPALAEQSSFHHALVGLAGLAEVIRALAAAEPAPATGEADDLVHALLGVVSLAEAVGRLGRLPDPGNAPEATDPPEPVEWLR